MGRPPAAADEGSMGLERLVFFSDAVLAIVITLLVLPLAAEVDISLYARRAGLLGLSAHGDTAAYLLTRSVATTVLFLASIGAAFLGGLRAGQSRATRSR